LGQKKKFHAVRLVANFCFQTTKKHGMKKIGLIGGMSWESTALYYQHINREVARRCGGLHSAPLHLVSLDFQEIADLQKQGDWARMTEILQTAARQLAHCGAEAVLICTNTMHRVAPQVQAATDLPLLHIADATADAVLTAGLSQVGLLGTRFTMEQAFMRDHLAARGIQCLVPDEPGRAEVHRIIFEELCRGQVLDASRQNLIEQVQQLAARGAQGVILGCTELTMSLQPGDGGLPGFDTTALHAMAAVDFCLS
jgi:aspartate racemase